VRRRAFIAGCTATLAAPAIARAQASQVLKIVPQADLGVLDPVWTTTYQTRDHGFMVFDTLFGLDDAFAPQPQMAEGVATEDDGKTWRITLRPGLAFHDGTKVLAKTPPSMCPIMPERLAVTDPFKQVTEMVGSGPFRYIANERVAGSRVVYERFAGYVPREGGVPQGTAGPKVVHFDRVEWQLIPDGGTVAAALRRGEVDWWLTPDADLLPPLRRDAKLTVENTVKTGLVATMRFNHLTKPFDNPAIRRALIGAVTQSDYMQGMVGTDPSLWRDGTGYFCPGTPMASDAGMTALTSPRDLAKVKGELAAAGYAGEKVVLLAPTDIASAKALADISADLLKRLGMTVDYQAMDWATLVQRRAKTDPVGQGGWSLFHTSWNGLDMLTPAGHVFLRGNGRAAAPGWPSSPRIEELRDAWFKAPDQAAEQAICRQIQLQAFVDVPYIPLGQYFAPTAYRADLTGVLAGTPVFWNLRRS
jgi:peptide/nickel transport system substrate-binding protein